MKGRVSDDDKRFRLLSEAEARRIIETTARTAEMTDLIIRAQRVIAMAEYRAGVRPIVWDRFRPGVRASESGR